MLQTWGHIKDITVCGFTGSFACSRDLLSVAYVPALLIPTAISTRLQIRQLVVVQMRGKGSCIRMSGHSESYFQLQLHSAMPRPCSFRA
jgi:hypothetical protein